MKRTIVLTGSPITKKNSQRIITVKGRAMIIPSKQYKDYEKQCLRQLIEKQDPIYWPCNIKCIYYMPTRRRVDLVNLIEATMDILVAAGVLMDDNCRIAASHDGSRVFYDKRNPRVEIEIEGEKEQMDIFDLLKEKE